MKKLANHIKSNSTTKNYNEILDFNEFEKVVDLEKYKELDIEISEFMKINPISFIIRI